MKKQIVLLLAFAVVFISINSCDKDDNNKKPIIKNLEIGHHNSKTVIRGNDLHIEADVEASNRIDKIIVDIHYECGHSHKYHKNLIVHDDEITEMEFVFDEYQGLRNTHFHKHVDIPKNAKPGEYHFHFKVIDKEGYTAEIHDDLEIKKE